MRGTWSQVVAETKESARGARRNFSDLIDLERSVLEIGYSRVLLKLIVLIAIIYILRFGKKIFSQTFISSYV